MVSLRELFSKTRLEYKILLVLALGLTLGFGSYVVYTVQAESAALLNQHRQKSRLFAESIKSGIRNIMLSGRPGYVRSLVEEAREEFRGLGSLKLYNNQSWEIFSDRERFVSRTTDDSVAIRLLKEEIGLPEESSGEYTVLRNEQACQTCHGTDHDVRGILQIDIPQSSTPSTEVAGHIATEAFKTIMLSGKGETADELMTAIGGIDGVTRAQIYDRDGYYIAFGDDENEVPEAILEEAAAAFATQVDSRSPLFYAERNTDTFIFGLENGRDCQVCHGSDHDVRGMLALSLDRTSQSLGRLPQEIAVLGFGNMMLMQRGMYAAWYVDRVRNLPTIERFKIFDNGRKHPEGVQELYLPNPQYTEVVFDDSVEHLILEAHRGAGEGPPRLEYQESHDDGMTYLTQIIPLMNDEKCQACHEPPDPGDPKYELYGDRWRIRSAVKVSTSMESVISEIQRNLYASVGVGFLTVLVVGIILRRFMRIVILRPLTVIGGTAQKVGEGNLAVSADVSSKDEIGALALQINKMIRGLRERLHLTKFVSEETVEAVREADITGISLGGERKEATVFFSDIRGFTSYSEKVEPEWVIEMLNTYLNEQAQIVREYNGDIDKFVGDELMAVFEGDKMVEDAIECARAIQTKVAELNQRYEAPIGVGIGINAGSMVMGAMGSMDRMDYTVLGDNVNLGARLCSAAKAGQILVTRRALDFLGKDHPFDLKELDPISVKGKKKPIPIYEVGYQV